MIGKVVKPGKGFRGLIDYLLKGPKDAETLDPNEDRVAWVDIKNMLIADPSKAPALMRATAAKSQRVQSPVYHFVISWHKNECPSEDIMRQVAETTLIDIGLDDHQALFVAHHDKAHRHVHIVVNRVNPDTGVAWRTSNDYQRIELSLRKQSEAMGLEIIPGKHSDPERRQDKTRRAKTSEYRKAQREQKPLRPQWSKSLITERREVLTFLVDTSTSWDQLKNSLAPLGITLERKGQGLVFADANGDMKLSSLGKTYRQRDLETRYNATFAPALDRPSDDQPHHQSQASPELPQKHATKSKTRLRRKTHPYRGFDKKPEPQADAIWAELAQARAATDYALILYRLGLSSHAALRRAFAEQDRAQQASDAAKPILEQLLKPDPKKKSDKPGPRPQTPTPSPRKRPDSKGPGRGR